MSSKLLELMSTLKAQEALSHLSLSSVCYVFGTHYLLEMMTIKIGMMMMVMVMTVEGDADSDVDDNGRWWCDRVAKTQVLI